MGNNEEFREERRGEDSPESPMSERVHMNACVCANNVNSARKTGRRQPVSH